MREIFFLLFDYLLYKIPPFLIKGISKYKIYDILLGIFVTCKLYIKIDDFKDKDPQSLRSEGPFYVRKKEKLPVDS